MNAESGAGIGIHDSPDNAFFKAGTYLALLDFQCGETDTPEHSTLLEKSCRKVFAKISCCGEKDILPLPSPGEARDFSDNFDHGLTMTPNCAAAVS